jgi:hypothetical protein
VFTTSLTKVQKGVNPVKVLNLKWIYSWCDLYQGQGGSADDGQRCGDGGEGIGGDNCMID